MMTPPPPPSLDLINLDRLHRNNNCKLNILSIIDCAGGESTAHSSGHTPFQVTGMTKIRMPFIGRTPRRKRRISARTAAVVAGLVSALTLLVVFLCFRNVPSPNNVPKSSSTSNRNQTVSEKRKQLMYQTQMNDREKSLREDSSASTSTIARTKANTRVVRTSQTRVLRKGSLGDFDFLWEAPAALDTEHYRAILFVAHGCGHAMSDWWWPDDNDVCHECLGLPEERAIVELALNLNLVVVAMSAGRRSGKMCWSRDDGPVVASVLHQFSADYFNHTLPILAFGASSGGFFVSTVLGPSLRQQQKQQSNNSSNIVNLSLSGYISQIAAAPDPWPLSSNSIVLPSPAVVLITMNRDVRTDAAATAVVEQLATRAVPVQHIRLPPLQMSADFFANRISDSGYDKNGSSSKMVQALQEAKMLSEDGFLLDDPRRSDWRRVLSPFAAAVGNDSLLADRSPLSEVLNAAWGMHEMSRDGVERALEFLLQHIPATS